MKSFEDKIHNETIYNELRYLGDASIIKMFEAEYRLHRERLDSDKVLYSDEIEKYDDFIQEVAELLYRLGYSSALECSLMISYLIKNGFFSDQQRFIGVEHPNHKEIACRLGATILVGRGCCRNFSAMLKDILIVLHEDVDSLYCYAGDGDINEKANHALNIINYMDNKYGIDLYNGEKLFYFEKPFVLREISTVSNTRLLYKPYVEITFGEKNLGEIKRRIEELIKCSKNESMSPFVYEYIRKTVRERMHSKRDVAYVFHERNKTLIKEVASSIR